MNEEVGIAESVSPTSDAGVGEESRKKFSINLT